MTAKLTASADGLSGSLAVGANEAFAFKPVAGGLELSQDGITFQTVDTDGKVAFPQSARKMSGKILTISQPYVNGTGNEIYVSMIVNSPAAVRVVVLNVDGTPVATTRAEFNVVDGFLCGVVPAGKQFYVALVQGSGGDVASAIVHSGLISQVTP